MPKNSLQLCLTHSKFGFGLYDCTYLSRLGDGERLLLRLSRLGLRLRLLEKLIINVSKQKSITVVGEESSHETYLSRRGDDVERDLRFR